MTSIIKVCGGVPCGKNLAQYTFFRAAKELGLDEKLGGTTSDDKITLQKCACMGKCAKGPIVKIQQSGNTKFHEKVTSVGMGQIIKTLKKQKKKQ